MKISYNWLKEFVDIKVGPQKLADDLSLFGHQAEKIDKLDNDYILDFEITPNRGDLLSILGMAREVAALYNLTVKIQNSKLQLKTQKLDQKLQISIKDESICPRYTARVIDNIKIGESPKWIKKRLQSYGFRPVNNIVDITNYVMIETGQPLHAFDYNKISQGIMNIRLSKNDESLTTLDGKERKLDKNSIVICDHRKIYDLAGIMGGFNSEVDQNTKTIILEVAIFNPVFIRRTSKQLKLFTDACYRYERGVDYEGTSYGVNRASQFIRELCPRVIVGSLHDIKSKKKHDNNIKIDIKRINSLLGTKLSQFAIIQYLNRLNIKYMSGQCIIPSYRQHDIKIWQDIAEEIARMSGYNKLGESKIGKIKTKDNPEYDKKEALKDLLAVNGFTEVYSYSFADIKLLEMLGSNLTNLRKVINGLSSETEYLRSSLLSSLLTAIAKNPWAPEIKIFELGRVFDKKKEKEQLAIATISNSHSDLKKILNLLKLRVEIKTVNQKILDFLKIRRVVNYTLIDLDEKILKTIIAYKEYPHKFAFQSGLTNNVKYRQISEFPPTIRDLAFIVDKKVDSEKVKNSILKLDFRILLVELFDEFSLDKLSVKSVNKNLRTKKNLAYHIWLQDLQSPMKEKNINEITKKIIKTIEKKFKAKSRGTL